MPREKFDVIVAGVGAMGSAACFHLARRGIRVLGLDADSTPNENGSSGGQSRMIRLCYYEHPDYVPLLRRWYELWDELCAVTGQPILRRTGGVYIGDPNGPSVAGSRRSARAHGLSHEMLSSAMLKERFPQFRVPAGYEALFEPNAGMVATATAIAAHLNLAIDFGGEIHAHEPVVSWTADDHGLVVETTKATYAADRLVVTTGSWTGDLLGDFGVPLEVTRQVLGWVWPRNPELFRVGRFPVWAIDDGEGSLHYGFPLVDGLPGPLGLKVAHHRPGPPTAPSSVDRRIKDSDEHDFRAAISTFLPDADGPLTGMKVCMYTNSLDSHFVVDNLPEHPEVTVACGFSGHGFKFAPVIGEALADLATTGRTRLPIGFLGIGRFRTARTEATPAPAGRLRT